MKQFKPKLRKIALLLQNSIEIPEYQREYTWKKELAEGLIFDFMKVFDEIKGVEFDNDKYKSHLLQINIEKEKDEMFYLGQMVRNDAQIVDGQQRLTTIVLMFKAISDFHKKNFREFPKEFQYLMRNADGAKLKSARTDREISNLMQNVDFTYRELEINMSPEKRTKYRKSKLYKNYIAIYKTLEKKNRENKLSKNYLTNLIMFIRQYVYLLLIDIEDITDAIKFFEIMNSKSVPLTAADLIKNNLIENAVGDKKKAASAWNKINAELVEYVGDLSKFIRYTYIANHGMVSLSQLFNTITSTKTEVLEQMGKYLESYKKLINIVETGSPSIDAKLNFILKLGARESLSPILLEILKVHREDDKTANDLLDELVAFSFRYFYIKGFKSNGYVNEITQVCKKIQEKNNDPFNILWKVYKKQIHDINDTDYINSYSKSWFEYTEDEKNKAMKFARAAYPLLAADMLSKNHVDSIEFKTVSSINIEQLDIEHIFPKNPDFEKSEWEPLENEDEKWCMGNLIPIANKKNRTTKNGDFRHKFNFYNGIIDSKGNPITESKKDASTLFKLLFRDISTEVNANTEWNDQQIKNRTQKIFEEFSKRDLFNIKNSI